MLSAELHNSTLSSAEFMATTNNWQITEDMNINTLLGSVSWEQTEPTGETLTSQTARPPSWPRGRMA